MATKTSAPKGDPKKADKAKIEEHAAEMLLSTLFNTPVAKPTRLGPNEKAWQAQERAKRDAELAKERRGKFPVYGVACAVRDPGEEGDCGLSVLDSTCFRTLDDAKAHIVADIVSISETKVKLSTKGRAKRKFKGGEYAIDFTGGVAESQFNRDCLVAKLVKDGVTYLYSVSESWIPKR